MPINYIALHIAINNCMLLTACLSCSRMLFVSTPIAAAASKRLFQFLITAVSAIIAYQSREPVLSSMYWHGIAARRIRVTPLVLRDGSKPGFVPSFSDAGLLHNRCLLQPSGKEWKNGTLEVRVIFAHDSLALPPRNA